MLLKEGVWAQGVVVGNKSVTEIIFAVIKATNAEHNNAVNQRE